MINLKQIKIACIGYILISIVFYITGVLCIVNSDLIQSHNQMLAGVILIAYGIIKIIGYFSKDLYKGECYYECIKHTKKTWNRTDF